MITYSNTFVMPYTVACLLDWSNLQVATFSNFTRDEAHKSNSEFREMLMKKN
jgi:hypothetical protein